MAGYPIDDGFPANRLFNQGYSYTYDDVIFLPHFIDFPTDSVQLSTKLTRNLTLSLPCVASPMDTVTESSMAVAMAALGGVGIVHSNNTPSDQASLIRHAKSHRIPFVSDPIFKSPSDSITSVHEFSSHPFIFVTDLGTKRSKFLGVVSKSDWEALDDKEARVCDYMSQSTVSVPSSYSFEQVAAYLAAQNLEFVPLVNEKDGEVVDVVTAADVERIQGFPKLGIPSLGSDGEFMVGASIGTRESDKERLEHLVKAGANVIVLDSSQGNSIYQIEMIKYVKRMYPELDVIGGKSPIFLSHFLGIQTAMDFFASKANSFLSGKTDDSQPENENKNQKPHHPQPSNSDLLSSAQLVADAAKSSFGGESDKVDKGKVAGAGADLLDAASKYGNLEGKSFGKYVDKAEDYLHQYHTSHSTTTTTTTNDFGHSTTETETTTTTTTTDSGKSATETTTPPTTTDLPAKTGGDGGSEGGYGDYLKMAEGFLKKH